MWCAEVAPAWAVSLVQLLWSQQGEFYITAAHRPTLGAAAASSVRKQNEDAMKRKRN